MEKKKKGLQASFVETAWTDIWYASNLCSYILRTVSETGTMRLILIYKFYIIPNVFFGEYASFQNPSVTYTLLDKESSQMPVV